MLLKQEGKQPKVGSGRSSFPEGDLKLEWLPKNFLHAVELCAGCAECSRFSAFGNCHPCWRGFWWCCCLWYISTLVRNLASSLWVGLWWHLYFGLSLGSLSGVSRCLCYICLGKVLSNNRCLEKLTVWDTLTPSSMVVVFWVAWTALKCSASARKGFVCYCHSIHCVLSFCSLFCFLRQPHGWGQKYSSALYDIELNNLSLSVSSTRIFWTDFSPTSYCIYCTF